MAKKKTKVVEGEESLDQLRDRVWAAWREQYTSPFPGGSEGWVEEVYDDHVVARLGEDHYSIPYADTDEGIVFDSDAATKVERTWSVVAEAFAAGDFLVRPLTEADEQPTGTEWEVVIIRSGESKNGRYYPAGMLKEAAPLFEGIRVMARSDDDHIAGRDKSVRNIVGWIDGVKYTGGALKGTLHVSEAAAWLKTLLVDAWNRGKRDIVGLSIVGQSTGLKSVTKGGKRVALVEGISKVQSVDVVYDPAAGGELLDLVAAVGKEESVDRLKKLIEAALDKGDAAVVKWLIEASDKDEVDELKEAAPDLFTKVDKLLTEAAKDAKVDPDPEVDPKAKKAKDKPIAEAVDDDEPEDLVPAGFASRLVVREALAETKLPEPVKERITKEFAGKEFSEADLTESIDSEIETWAKLEKDGLVRSQGSGRADVSVGTEETDLVKAALDGMILGEAVEVDGKKVRPYRSLKQAYIDLTGDEAVSGQLPSRPSGKLGISEANGGRVQYRKLMLTEAITPGEVIEDGSDLVEAIATGGFTEILGDSIRRKMVAEYRRSDLRSWDPLVDVVPASDFRTNRITRFGGYANLAAVAQGAAYAAMTSPTDEEATWAVSKRGGTETINLEVIANDDLGFVRRIPTRMARAAAQTLHEFVYEFINANGAIYDGVVLFHATHANLGSTALGVASLNAARQRMRKQAEKDNSKRLGFVPAQLWVPIELEETAYVLTQSERKPGTADNDASFARAQNLTYTVVDYWTDANNWFVSADKAAVPLLEVGFYGPEDPEIFVQDMPNVGSMFTNDQATYKIRHIYGGAVLDFRGLDGSVVA